MTMTKLEQIEKLREKAKVSYDDAKTAYEATDGDLLEALIYLEKQGKVATPDGGGYYRTGRPESESEKQTNGSGRRTSSADNFTDTLDRIGKFCVKVIHKGNTTTFDVLKGDESKAKFPVTVIALLLLFAPYITIPLVVIGLALGYRYRFSGFEGDVF